MYWKTQDFTVPDAFEIQTYRSKILNCFRFVQMQSNTGITVFFTLFESFHHRSIFKFTPQHSGAISRDPAVYK